MISGASASWQFVAEWRLLCDGFGDLLAVLREVFWAENLTNFGFALPLGPILSVELHKTNRTVDSLLFRFQFKLRVTADHFFGLGEGAVGDGEVSFRNADTGALLEGELGLHWKSWCRL